MAYICFIFRLEIAVVVPRDEELSLLDAVASGTLSEEFYPRFLLLPVTRAADTHTLTQLLHSVKQ